jgi:hypothetical protein
MLTAADCCPLLLGLTLQVGSMNQPTFLVGQNIQSSANSVLHEPPCSGPLRVRENDGPAPIMNSTVASGDGKGRVRRIAIVALARKLLVALWRYLETGLVPTGAVFKAR